MTDTPSGFDAISRYCLAITSSLELDEVIQTTVASIEELLPSTSVTVTVASPDGDTTPQSMPDPTAVLVPLSVGSDDLGTLQVVAPEAPLTSGQRTLLTALVPTIASALRNALFLARQRAAWEDQRHLDRQKARFIRLAASGLDEPLRKASELATELQAADDDSMRATATHLVSQARYLAQHVEEIFRLSLTQGSQIVLPEG